MGAPAVTNEFFGYKGALGGALVVTKGPFGCLLVTMGPCGDPAVTNHPCGSKGDMWAPLATNKPRGGRGPL